MCLHSNQTRMLFSFCNTQCGCASKCKFSIAHRVSWGNRADFVAADP